MGQNSASLKSDLWGCCWGYSFGWLSPVSSPFLVSGQKSETANAARDRVASQRLRAAGQCTEVALARRGHPSQGFRTLCCGMAFSLSSRTYRDFLKEGGWELKKWELRERWGGRSAGSLPSSWLRPHDLATPTGGRDKPPAAAELVAAFAASRSRPGLAGLPFGLTSSPPPLWGGDKGVLHFFLLFVWFLF